ncbi:MAG: DUF692 domain-containing protein [Bacteroidales bacterium]|nr:DUF692 domain-containing protein [Bacteroidales bacterium]
MIGLGFRRDFSEELIRGDRLKADFIEFAPENWMGVGGYWGRIVKEAIEKFPVHAHGLSLSVGSPGELDYDFLAKLKTFLDDFGVQVFSEHLSFAKAANAHVYDLLPIPFREDAVKHVAKRIRQVQDFLERRIAIENVSYYTPVAAEMDEATFIRSVVEEADCDLLLDVNNVYVNAFNHGYDAKEFISRIPLERVVYIHMAGHEQIQPDLIIDTHGQPIIDPVYELFDWTVQRIKPVPVLLERDFNYDDLDQIQDELINLKNITKKHWEVEYAEA